MITAAFALEIDGADTQGKSKFSIGLEQEFVFKRKYENNLLTFSRSWVDTSGFLPPFTVIYAMSPSVVEANRTEYTLLKLSYGLLDNVDLYVKLGTLDGKFRETATGSLTIPGLGTVYGAGGASADLQGANFAYGAGLKAKQDLGGGWLVGIDSQYLRYKSAYRVSNLFHGMLPFIGGGTAQETWEGKFTVQQWHVAPYIGKKLGDFTPYVGVRYSDCRVSERSKPNARSTVFDAAALAPVIETSATGYKAEYRAANNFGVFIGTDYTVDKSFKLNLETHFIDEYALGFSGTYKFTDSRDFMVSKDNRKRKITLGLEQGFIFRKDLDKDNWFLHRDVFVTGVGPGSFTYNYNFTTSQLNKMSSTLFKLGYKLLEHLQLFLKFGTSNDAQIRQAYNSSLTIVPPVGPVRQGTMTGDLKWQFEGPTCVYGAGFDTQYDLKNGWFVGAEAQYLRQRSDYTAENSGFMTIPAVPVTSMYSYERWRGTFTFDQWHVSAHLGKRISKVTPYLGVRYSDLRIKDRARSGALHLEETFALDAVYDLSDYTRVLKARNNFGAYVGTGFDINKNFKLNFEAHFIDEYALTFAGTLSF